MTCNKKVKFDALLQKARELGCDVLATGHYARVRRDHTSGRYRLLRSLGGEKDQSYVLYATTQDQLSRVVFPLGELGNKAEVRRMAKDAGLPVYAKPDSQEICFVSEAGGYREFLRKSKPDAFEEGELVTASGEVVGRHDGVADFTIGQRRGLGTAFGRPMYVIAIEPQSRRVVVGEGDDLQQKEVHLSEMAWSAFLPEQMPMRVMAKIRYNMDARPATLFVDPEPRLVFDEPVRAVTPGQIAVAYRGQSVVGGGKIL